MSNAIVPTTIDGIEIDRVAILQALKLNPKDPKTQALILVCERYGLDPLLKHMVLVDGNPYVTRDGYLHLAHASGKFDGIEVVEVGETGSHWTAKVSVWRKDMTRPVTYAGRYPKDGSNKKYGPEMAIKTAEVAALRRAFNVTGIGAVDEQWDAQPTVMEAPQPALGPAPELASEDLISGLVERLKALTLDDRRAFVERFGKPQELPATRAIEAEAFVTDLEEDPFPAADQAGPDDDPEGPIGTRVTVPQAQRVHIDAKELGFTEEELDVLILHRTGGVSSSAKDLTPPQMKALIEAMRELSEQPDREAQVAEIRSRIIETAGQQTMVAR